MSYWDKQTGTLFAPVRDDPKAQDNAAWVRKWLAALVDGTRTVEQFDAAIPPKRSRLIAQYMHIHGTADEFYAVCVAQIERRMQARGLIWCKWRGWIPIEDFDLWRWDNAAERAAKPNKHDGRAA